MQFLYTPAYVLLALVVCSRGIRLAHSSHCILILKSNTGASDSPSCSIAPNEAFERARVTRQRERDSVASIHIQVQSASHESDLVLCSRSPPPPRARGFCVSVEHNRQTSEENRSNAPVCGRDDSVSRFSMRRQRTTTRQPAARGERSENANAPTQPHARSALSFHDRLLFSFVSSPAHAHCRGQPTIAVSVVRQKL